MTLEQLAEWLSATHEPDIGPISAESKAQLRAFLSKDGLAKSGHTRSQVRQGFVQAANARISQMEWWSEEDRKKVDVLLAERGLPDLRTMELVLKKKHKGIVSRGTVRNDEEYYIVKELLDGPSSVILSEEEIRTLWGLRSAYESSVRK